MYDTIYQLKEGERYSAPGKIIACTNKTLNLPGISKDTIKKYMIDWNRGLVHHQVEIGNIIYSAKED